MSRLKTCNIKKINIPEKLGQAESLQHPINIFSEK